MVSIDKPSDMVTIIKNSLSENEYNYILEVIGDEERLSILFQDQKNIKNILMDIGNDIELLEKFHKVYLRIKDQYNSNNPYIKNLLIIDIAYTNLKKHLYMNRQKKEKGFVLSEQEANLKLEYNIKKMIDNNKQIDNYPYKEFVKQIREDSKDFSLNKQFCDEGFKYSQGLNSVSVITPNQTISRFNDSSVNGLTGSGHHDENFMQIVQAIYGRNFNCAQTCQDIKIRYVTSMINNNQLKFMMTLELPLIINSTQKKALSILNEDIKSFNDQGQKIEIYALITDYIYKDYTQTINNQSNLDKILDLIAIDDNQNYRYSELYLVGYPNGEKHFNNSYIKK